MNENKDVIVLMDDNIDSSISNFNNRYKVDKLMGMLDDHLNKFNLSQCNFDYTRVVSHQQPSCIDHIYSNCADKITNIQTINNIDSDHKYIVCNYSTKESQYHPKNILVRDYTQLYTSNIKYCIDKSDNLNEIFTSSVVIL